MQPSPSRQPHIAATWCCGCHCHCRPSLRTLLPPRMLPIAAAITAAVARRCNHCCHHGRSCHRWCSLLRPSLLLSRHRLGSRHRCRSCHCPLLPLLAAATAISAAIVRCWTVSFPLWLSLLHHDKEINNQPICGFICLL